MGRRIALAAALAALAAVQAAAAGTLPTRAGYARAVGAICARYEQRLLKIPAPSGDLAHQRAAAARALPLLRAQLAEIQRVPAPVADRATVATLLYRSEASIAALEQLAHAKSEEVAAAALVVFLGDQQQALAASAKLGISCAPKR